MSTPADKDECFLAAYDASADIVIALIAAAAADEDRPWRERVADGVAIYLDTLASDPW